MKAERKAFKEYFDSAAAQALATQLALAYPAMPRKRFIDNCKHNINQLEFAARVALRW
ncbi:MAG: hypothetical protein ACU84Q_01785 [Gammaproteobacteria bacterium]